MRLTKQNIVRFQWLGIQARIKELQDEIKLLRGYAARGKKRRPYKRRETKTKSQQMSESMKRVWENRTPAQRRKHSKLMLAAKNGKKTA